MRYKIEIGLLFLLSIGIVTGAYWVNDFNNCPNNYQSQTCSGSDLVCGYSGGVTYCYTPPLIAPAVTVESITDQDSGSINGGYIIDCYYYDGSAPHCDNSASYWCDRNSTCYTTQLRYTNCTASLFGKSFCARCRSDYLDCDTDNPNCEIDVDSSCDTNAVYKGCDGAPSSGDLGQCNCSAGYYDCDNDDSDSNNRTDTTSPRSSGNGCEVQTGSTSCSSGSNNYQFDCSICKCDSGWYDCDSGWNQDCDDQHNSACSTGGLDGTLNCQVGTGGCYAENGGTEYDCVCEIDPVEYGWSGVEYKWSGSTPFLWFNLLNNGIGALINVSNNITIINGSGIYYNGFDLSTDTGGAGSDTWWDISTSNWMVNNSDILDWNETKGNLTYVNFTGYNNTYWDRTYYNVQENQTIWATSINNCSVAGSCINIAYETGALFTGSLNISNNNKIQFRDKELNITSPTDAKLELNSDGEIEFNTQTLDYNCALGVSFYDCLYTQSIRFNTNMGVTFRDDSNLKIYSDDADDIRIDATDTITFDSNEVYIPDTNKIIIRDEQINISSPVDGKIVIEADTEIIMRIGSNWLIINTTGVYAQG